MFGLSKLIEPLYRWEIAQHMWFQGFANQIAHMFWMSVGEFRVFYDSETHRLDSSCVIITLYILHRFLVSVDSSKVLI